MYDRTTDIAALISSRICHDLASPIGAICNGLELLELSNISHMPEIALLNESVGAANARLQFFRVAYGTAAKGAMILPEAVEQILKAYFTGQKSNAHWKHPRPIPRIAAKLLFLLIQCLETALPYGGDIYLAEKDGTWQLKGSGRLKIDSPIWAVLKGANTENTLQPSQIHFEMARGLAAETGKIIAINHTDEDICITVSPAR